LTGVPCAEEVGEAAAETECFAVAGSDLDLLEDEERLVLMVVSSLGPADFVVTLPSTSHSRLRFTLTQNGMRVENGFLTAPPRYMLGLACRNVLCVWTVTPPDLYETISDWIRSTEPS
jgi:hypothetical protein